MSFPPTNSNDSMDREHPTSSPRSGDDEKDTAMVAQLTNFRFPALPQRSEDNTSEYGDETTFTTQTTRTQKVLSTTTAMQAAGDITAAAENTEEPATQPATKVAPGRKEASVLPYPLMPEDLAQDAASTSERRGVASILISGRQNERRRRKSIGFSFDPDTSLSPRDRRRHSSGYELTSNRQGQQQQEEQRTEGAIAPGSLPLHSHTLVPFHHRHSVCSHSPSRHASLGAACDATPSQRAGEDVVAVDSEASTRLGDAEENEGVHTRAYCGLGADPKNSSDATVAVMEKVRQRGRTSFFSQLLAVLQRTGRQLWTEKFFVLVELVVPLLFIVLVVVLDVAFGTEPIPADDFPPESDWTYRMNSRSYLVYTCYGNYTRPINGLRFCSTPGRIYRCGGDADLLPVEMLCYDSEFPNMGTVVNAYVASFTKGAIAVPPLDSIIVHQWIAKKGHLAEYSRTLSALSALSSLGLGASSNTRYDAITYSGLLYFAPADRVPAELIDYFNKTSGMFRYVYGGTYDTVEEAEEVIRVTAAEGPLSRNSPWGLVVVNDLVDGFDVEIKLHGLALPMLKPTVDLSYRGGFAFDGSDIYLASGYVSIQKMLYDYYLVSKSNGGVQLPGLNLLESPIYPILASFPSIADKRSYLLEMVAPLIAFVVVLAFLYPFAQMTKRLVLEKELRIREAMLIMGLRRSVLWTSVFLVNTLECVIISALLTLLLCVSVLRRSNAATIFLLIFVFSMTLVPLVGLLSTFFSKARLAALLAPLVYFVISMLIFAMNGANERTMLGLSIFSPTAFAILMRYVFETESGGGFSIAEVRGNALYVPEPYKLMLMLMGDYFIYLLLMVYLDAVLPQEWGSTKHPLFFIIDPLRALISLCRSPTSASGGNGSGGGLAGNHDSGLSNASSSQEQLPHDERRQSELHSGSSAPLKGVRGSLGSTSSLDPYMGLDPMGNLKFISVRLQGLTKTFSTFFRCKKSTRLVAADNVTLDLYGSEISVLLGPNGAGKSTVINMMTGMLPADTGDCIIEGVSVRRDLSKARHHIGYCPQHNILWPNLTCRAHLQFFAKIKGLSGQVLDGAVNDILRAVDLMDKANSTPKTLSGGQKRKLSVAIAFVGLSKVVLLDEPTAGMDPAARRHVWSLLRAMSQTRTILMTTHYMDEADLLGDNIAIVNQGKLLCAGSSLFLRAYARCGYILRFDLLPLLVEQDGLTEVAEAPASSQSPSINPEQLRQQRLALRKQVWEMLQLVVRRHVPAAVLLLQTSSEVEYEVPSVCEKALPGLLRAMEARGAVSLGVRSYAVCAPTLEEAFMTIIGTNFRSAVLPGGGGQGTDETASLHAVESIEGGAVITGGRRMSRASALFMESLSNSNWGNNMITGGGSGGGNERPPVRNEAGSSSFALDSSASITFATLSAQDTNDVGESSGNILEKTIARSPTPVAPGSGNAEAGGGGTLAVPALQALECAGPPAGTDADLDLVWSMKPVSSAWRRGWLQLQAMLYKRLFYALRDRRMQFFQVVCPVFCILLAMLLQRVDSEYTGSIYFTPALFRQPTELVASQCDSVWGNATEIGASGHDLSMVHVDTPDVENVTILSTFLQQTWHKHRYPRYAAIQCLDSDLQAKLMEKFPYSVAGRPTPTIMYNTSSKHSLPYALHTTYVLTYMNVMRSAGSSEEEIRNVTFRMGVMPLPAGSSSKSSKSAIASILIGVIVLIPFTFMPSNPVVWVTKEREIRARHLQKLSGLHFLIYWAGNLIFDMIAYLITLGLVFALFAIFKRWEYVGRETVGAALLSFILYGLCCCLGSYTVSFMFSEHSTAQVVVMGVSFLAGFICVLLVFVLGLLNSTRGAAHAMRWIFRVIPSYCIGEVILNLALLKQNQLVDPQLHPWSMDVTVFPDIYMAAEIPLFALLTLLLEHPFRIAFCSTLSYYCCRWDRFHVGRLEEAEAEAKAQALRMKKDDDEWNRRQRTEAAEEMGAEGRNSSVSSCLRTVRRRRRSSHEAAWVADDFLTMVEIPADREDVGGTATTAVFHEGSPTAMRSDGQFGTTARRRSLQAASTTSTGVFIDAQSGPASPSVSDRRRRWRRGGATGTTPGAAANAAVVSGCAGGGGSEASPRPRSGVAPNCPYGGVSSHLYPPPHITKEDFDAAEEEDSDVEMERLAVYEDELTVTARGGGRRRRRRLAEEIQQDVIRVVDLRKEFGSRNKVAVRSLAFSVMPGEVFGFLGTNGAGKSTTISIITQEQRPTSGRVYVCGHDVVKDSAAAMQCIGYCPQFDACLDLLTVKEQLNVYASIRGVPGDGREQLVASLIRLCGLEPYKHTLSRQLSGGNRRKLSVAIALVGAPRVVCLDEPSAGMDPLARRTLWRALNKISSKCSILLTTHHLEEVEALADCVSIMIDGSLRCMGDLPHLKGKYAQNAYQLTIRVQSRGGGANALAAGEGEGPLYGSYQNPRRRSRALSYGSVDYWDADDRLVKFMSHRFPSAVLMETFNNEKFTYALPAAMAAPMGTEESRSPFSANTPGLYRESSNPLTSDQTPPRGPNATASNCSPPFTLQQRPVPNEPYSVSPQPRPTRSVRLSEVFAVLQKHKDALDITDFSVSQVSLEQVFLNVCRDGEENNTNPDGQAGVRSGNSAAAERRENSVNIGAVSRQNCLRSVGYRGPPREAATLTAGGQANVFAEYRRKRWHNS